MGAGAFRCKTTCATCAMHCEERPSDLDPSEDGSFCEATSAALGSEVHPDVQDVEAMPCHMFCSKQVAWQQVQPQLSISLTGCLEDNVTKMCLSKSDNLGIMLQSSGKEDCYDCFVVLCACLNLEESDVQVPSCLSP